jgi:nucleoside-diphosphate-sugar epimerase
MKIAITGANGFVGSNLVSYFQSEGHEVLAFVRSVASAQLLETLVKTIIIDYEDTAALYSALLDCDVVIHNAGKTKALYHEEMMETNVGITENIIIAINLSDKPVQLIYISSQAASRPSFGNVPVKESDNPAPLTSYGKSKLAAEMLIRKTCTKPFTIIRPCSVYGYGDKDFLALFRMVRLGFSISIGKEDKLMNMISVNELASFIGLCLNNPSAYGETFFATDGQVYSQKDVLAYIALALHKTPRQVTVPKLVAKLVFYSVDAFGRVFSVPTLINRDKMKEIMADGWLADPSKAKEKLGWNPEANLKLHILETAKCYHELGWL